MKNILRRIAALSLLLALVGTSPAQLIYWEDHSVPPVINVGTLDAEISRGKHEAAKAQEPALEFEIVKLAIKDYVDRNRSNDYQSVVFATPDRFRSWLRDTARKSNRTYFELLDEIVQVVAPNPVPDLTGDVNDIRDAYLTERAMENVQRRKSEEAELEGNVQEPEVIDEGTGPPVDSSLLEDGPANRTPPRQARVPQGPAGDPALIRIEFSDSKTSEPVKKARPAAKKKSR